MLALRYMICDVFTDRALTGNPLAVFTNPPKLDSELLQALTREMAFSESVFVFPPSASGHAQLRIFTPTIELAFAGHPTLGAAFVIGTTVQLDVLSLETRAGIVPVRLERDGARVAFGRMAQPLPTWQPFEHVTELLDALGIERSLLPVLSYDNGARHVYVKLATREAVRSLKPDFERLAGFAGCGVYVFAGHGTEYKARMFHPGAGIREDPATGSAAGPLAVHLARHGLIQFGEEIRIEQGAELDRPSVLYARAEGTPAKLELVEIGGAAVIVARGEFKLAL